MRTPMPATAVFPVIRPYSPRVERISSGEFRNLQRSLRIRLPPTRRMLGLKIPVTNLTMRE